MAEQRHRTTSPRQEEPRNAKPAVPADIEVIAGPNGDETASAPPSSAGQHLREDQKAFVAAAYAFVRARNRPAAIYFLADDQAIGTPNVRKLAAMLSKVSKVPKLDLVIHASGGDIHAAYQLVAFLRRRTDLLTACVPRYARSAATLLCVGAKSICLDEVAAVGPLDAQMYVGLTSDGRHDYQSALNHFKSLERLQDFSLETLRGVAEMLHERNVRRSDELLKHAMEFVGVTAAPLYEKIEAQRLGDYSQALAIGEEYGRRLLGRLPRTQRERIVKELVHGYPSHEYVIDADELRRLGLDAEVFEGEAREAAWSLAEQQAELAQRRESAIMFVKPVPVVSDELIDPPVAIVSDHMGYGYEAKGATTAWFGRQDTESDNPWSKVTARLRVGREDMRHQMTPGPLRRFRKLWEEEEDLAQAEPPDGPDE